MKNNKRLVNRYFTSILYEDDPNFKKYFENIMVNYKDVTWIEHDKDLDENGENKKKHIHILYKVGENARSIKSVSKEIRNSRKLHTRMQ